MTCAEYKARAGGSLINALHVQGPENATLRGGKGERRGAERRWKETFGRAMLSRTSHPSRTGRPTLSVCQHRSAKGPFAHLLGSFLLSYLVFKLRRRPSSAPERFGHRAPR